MVQGTASKTSSEVSDMLFSKYSRGQQLTSSVSRQSESMDSMSDLNLDYLEVRIEELNQQFDEKNIPRPNNWGGYMI